MNKDTLKLVKADKIAQEENTEGPPTLSSEEMAALLKDPNFRASVASMAAALGFTLAPIPNAMRVKGGHATAMDAIREAHTTEEVEYAEKWVNNAFQPMIKMEKVSTPEGEVTKGHIMVLEIWSTERTNKQGLIKGPLMEEGRDPKDGNSYWREHHGFYAEDIAAKFIDVINANKGKPIQECLLAMIDYAEEHLPAYYSKLKYLVKERKGQRRFVLKKQILK